MVIYPFASCKLHIFCFWLSIFQVDQSESKKVQEQKLEIRRKDECAAPCINILYCLNLFFNSGKSLCHLLKFLSFSMLDSPFQLDEILIFFRLKFFHGFKYLVLVFLNLHLQIFDFAFCLTGFRVLPTGFDLNLTNASCCKLSNLIFSW